MDTAIDTLIGYFRALLGVFLGVLGYIDRGGRQLMTSIGVPYNLQQIVLLVVAVLFIIASLRLFAGLFRLILVVFFLLLILHILVPGIGI